MNVEQYYEHRRMRLHKTTRWVWAATVLACTLYLGYCATVKP